MKNSGLTAKTRRQPVQARAREKLARIVQGAKDAIVSDGIDALNMRQIAKTADVGLGTLYDYFPSRSDLICHVAEERLSQKLAVFDKAIEDTPNSGKIRDFISNYRTAMEDAGFGTLFDGELSRAAAKDEKVALMIASYREQAVDRYTMVLRNAGSDWTKRQLEPMARFLLQLSEHVEPGAGFDGTAEDSLIVRELIAKTIANTLKRTLQPR